MSLPPARGRSRGPGPTFAGAGGISTIHLLLTLAISASVLALAGASLAHFESSVSVRSAAGEVAAAMYRARATAIMRGTNVGLKFRRNGDRYEWTIYADGNGDGVRTIDITRGVDKPVASFTWSRNDVLPGILTGTRVPDPSGSGYLDRPDDPIRFNSSDICSFSPIGESTPGSVYLWDGRDRMAVVRIFGRTGKMRTLYYRRGERSWTP